MNPALRTVNKIPLECLWNDQGDIQSTRTRYLSSSALRNMLRTGPVEFYVANIGKRLQLIAVKECYEFWKSEVQPHLVEDPEAGIYLDEFPDEYAYLASEWRGDIQIPIVLLEMYH